jgi:hypothetical protein
MSPATFILDNDQKRERCAKRVLALPMDGQIWDVTIKEWQPQRSVEANRRLWALHKAAADATGHSVDELHELMKLKFLPRSRGEGRRVRARSRQAAAPSSRRRNSATSWKQVESFYIQELGVVLGEYA